MGKGAKTLITTPGTGNANALYPGTPAVICGDASMTCKRRLPFHFPKRGDYRTLAYYTNRKN